MNETYLITSRLTDDRAWPKERLAPSSDMPFAFNTPLLPHSEFLYFQTCHWIWNFKRSFSAFLTYSLKSSNVLLNLVMLRLLNRRLKSRFFENRIESKWIFWLVFVIDCDSRLYWRRQFLNTAYCSEFKAWQSEPQCAEYADLITWIVCHGSCAPRPPTPV